MESIVINNHTETLPVPCIGISEERLPVEETSTNKPFINANTMEISLEEMRDRHIIPVFIKDNEPVISHSDFINAAYESVVQIFPHEAILKPAIRLSHPVKGRVPEARNKPAKELFDHEKTIYYERMAFIIELPSIYDHIDGQKLSMTVGGVKAYNLDNLYNRKGVDEHFKVFIGFQNKVCTNLCVWTDGYLSDLKVKNLSQLQNAILQLFSEYDAVRHIEVLNKFPQYQLSEKQFAQLIGRCRMYRYLPDEEKENIQPFLFGDSQINTVCRDYYRDNSFCRTDTGEINLWKLYNLFTGANKSTYVDSFLDRSVNAFQFCEELRSSLDESVSCWYLN